MYYLNVTVHVLAALIWLGGMLFLAAVGAPVLRKVENLQLRAALFRELGQQFRLVGWICIAVLLVTGVLNLHFRGLLHSAASLDGVFWATRYGHTLAGKLSCVVLMLLVQAVHDFRLGPAASRLAAGSAAAAVMRKWAARMARFNAIVGVVLVYFAVRLARGG
jgi:putative copper resistance protein D